MCRDNLYTFFIIFSNCSGRVKCRKEQLRFKKKEGGNYNGVIAIVIPAFFKGGREDA